MKVLIVGDFSAPGSLTVSYRNGFAALRWEVVEFDLYARQRYHRRFGRIGVYLDSLIPVEQWLHKANRELVIACRQQSPDLIVIISSTPVRVGTLAQIQVATKSKIAFVWPDTLHNLNQHICQCLPLYDLVASYSQAAVPAFQKLGAKSVEWVPLGCDSALYSNATQDDTKYQCDVSFVGNWRPEREAALAQLSAIQGIKVRIWGENDWQRRASNEFVKKNWQGKALYTNEFASAIRASKLSLNIIDDTNFPAANMRFFELPCVGAVQISSACPEMQPEFLHGDHVIYYHNEVEFLAQVKALIGDETTRNRIKTASQELVLNKHTYTHRAQQIVNSIS